jgi:hypothetical protein
MKTLALAFATTMALTSFAFAQATDAPKSPGMETSSDANAPSPGTNPHTGEGMGAVKQAPKKAMKNRPAKGGGPKSDKDASSTEKEHSPQQ